MAISSARRGRWASAVIAGAVVAATLLAGCTGETGGGSSSGGGHSDEISYALPANATPNWLMPLGIAGKLATHNASLIATMYEPLVAYDGSTGTVKRVDKADLAKSIAFSKDGRTATITLDKRTWSDGKPVTSADVAFFIDLVKANKAEWASYTQGAMPDDVTAVKTPNDQTVQLTFDKAYNQDWLIATQLVLITPIPVHAWSITKDGGTPDPNLAKTPAGAKAIWKYLIGQGKNLSGYQGNALFKVTDGPYALKAFSDSGKVTLAKNTKYDGADPAHIGTVNFLPYTSSDAEVAAVRSGAVDYGYIPTSELSDKSQYSSLGYNVVNWDGWSITYMPYNFNNPTMGPVFSQLYVRQALQGLVDQKSISKVVWHGAAQPGYGPVPQNPDNKFLSTEQKNNPYPFNPGTSQKLLTSHGWALGSDGVFTCTTGAKCGTGIKDGQKLNITILTQSGSKETDQMFASMKSTFEKAGVGFTIKSAPLNTVLGSIAPCKPADSGCTWQLPFFGTLGSWYFNGDPTGERIFATGAASNFGSYNDPKFDQLMQKTLVSNDPSAMQEYSAYGAKNLPVMWMPNPVYQISVIKQGLTGTTQDSLGNFHPQRWTWSK